jgi:prolyl oligopeptidase
MLLATVSLSLMLAVEDASRADPPVTPEHDVVENYHGRWVQDPYRWLEQAGAPAVEQWIDAQNAYTDAVMSGFRGHDAIIERVGQLALTSTQRSNPQNRRQRTLLHATNAAAAAGRARHCATDPANHYFAESRS